MMYGYGFSMIGGVAMMILWVVVLGAIVWGVVYFVQKAGQAGQPVAYGETPLDALKRRYAAGEISREQFEEMRHTLGV